LSTSPTLDVDNNNWFKFETLNSIGISLIFPVYRQGDRGTSWYIVILGTLDVHVSKTGIVEVKHHP